MRHTRLLAAVVAVPVLLLGLILGLTTVGPMATDGPDAAPAPAGPADPTDDVRSRPKLSVLNLGDSYSAGNGAGRYRERECWRSPLNYGRRFADNIGARYSNVACSGGVVADLTFDRLLERHRVRKTFAVTTRKAFLRRARVREVCGGTPARDLYHRYRLGRWSRSGGESTGRVRCTLMARAQVRSVHRGTDKVILTIGGNDIGFVGIVGNCLALRDPQGCRTAIRWANSQIPSLRDRTRDALREIHRRSPRARVYVLAYPMLIDRRHYGIPEANPRYDAGAALTALQRRGDRVMRRGMRRLNRQVGAKRFYFVGNVKEYWAGHGLDPREGADNSDAWLVGVGESGRDMAEWVHPRARGYAATARALTRYYRTH